MIIAWLAAVVGVEVWSYGRFGSLVWLSWLIDALRREFARRGWEPFAFQKATWDAYGRGESGLVQAQTGTGKTLAAWGGMLIEECGRREAGEGVRGKAGGKTGIRYLWLTPMRALAGDTHKSLVEAAGWVGLRAEGGEDGFGIELRTGDTSSAMKVRQRDKPPAVLITTPESLSVMLSYPVMREHLAAVRDVVVDEWHELLGTKRGVQTELCLAAVRGLAAGGASSADGTAMRVWGLSATVGNTGQALDALLGSGPQRERARLVTSDVGKEYRFEVLIPEAIERFPWAGHLGIRMLEPVLARIESAASTLVFTNTRSQSEIWFQSILRARPDLIGQVAIHHGSLDRDVRTRVEEMVKGGKLRAVVCTSSLDLGVDFPPVDQVIQIGSPKGVARLVQRAGRSGHQPGRISSIVCVPTNALELVEFAAARDAVMSRAIETREALTLSLDVLCQHILTAACGSGPEGMSAEALRDEVRTTHAFAAMSDEQFGWAMDFARQGGQALTAYGRFARLVERVDEQTGEVRYVVANQPLVKLHRLGIGTITSDPAMKVTTRGGAVLGTIEEGFIAKLSPGDVFVFSGRRLRLVKVHQMMAITEPALNVKSGMVPAWAGTRMPLSHELAEAVKVKLAAADGGDFASAEMAAVRPLLELQQAWSALPKPGTLVIERLRSREGYHAFVYPLVGRLVHEGLVALAAYRIAARSPHTFSMSASDYGFELLSQTPFDLDAGAWREVLAAERLTEDLLGCVNQAELARRQFREIARIAGLIVPSYPGQARSARSLQASSELFFDVFSEFDPQNMLLGQARREVMERQLEFGRMKRALEAIGRMEIVIKAVPKLTPFAFPLWVDRLRSQLSSEKVEDRIVRMIGHLEDAAGTVAEPEFADLQDAGELPSKARRGRRADGKTKAKVPWRRPRL